MLRDILRIFPYELHIVQQLQERDYEALVQLDNQRLQYFQTDEFVLSRIIYFDDYFFHFNGMVNNKRVEILRKRKSLWAKEHM